MTRIAVVTPCVVPGDAVSIDVIGMQKALALCGYAADIYADTSDSSIMGIRHVGELPALCADPSNVIIYHHSIGWDFGLSLLLGAKCKTVVKYHNVTPPHFFKGISSGYVAVCRAGREQIRQLADARCDLYLSDSEYNMTELVVAGAPESRNRVVPPFHDIDRLYALEGDLAVLDAYRDGKTNVLMVGRMAPNKGHVTLIEAFRRYHCNYSADSRLLIVGKEDPQLSLYSDGLRDMILLLGLENAVVFASEVSQAALKAYYLLADVFMITSEHEGFCVPLVEAMAMRVPIVAYGSTAVPKTVNDAALVWDSPDPEHLAESLNFIARDESLRLGLGLRGWQQYRERFTREKIMATLVDALEGLL